MRLTPSRRRANMIAALAVAACSMGFLAPGASADGSIVVSGAEAKATMPGARVAAAYMQLANTGKTPVTLTAATSPVCETVELHTMSMNGGIMRMRPITGGVTISPGSTIAFTPGGMHLMLTGLKQQLTPATAVPITLTFAGAPAQTLQFTVKPMGDGAHHHH
jgi:copper(I)-binding protein